MIKIKLKAKEENRKKQKRDLEQTISLILDILTARDKYNLFSAPIDSQIFPEYYKKDPIDLSIIRSRSYENLDLFQNDVEKVFLDAIGFFDGFISKQAQILLELCAKLFAKEEGHKKRQAIFRRATDGSFLFSSLRKKEFEGQPLIISKTMNDMEVIDIEPLPENPAPTLGHTISSGTKPTQNNQKKCACVHVFDFEPYQSFSPMFDSHRSNLSIEESCLLESKSNINVDEADDFFLSHSERVIGILSGEEDVNIEDMEVENIQDDSLKKSKVNCDSKSESLKKSIQSIILQPDSLERNLQIINILAKLQRERMLTFNFIPSDEEEQLASLLLHSLAESIVPLKAKVDNLICQYVPFEPSFSGSLPPSRPFAFVSNGSDAPSVPITATMVPLHFTRPRRKKDSSPPFMGSFPKSSSFLLHKISGNRPNYPSISI